jgi:uncharacterized membrane protein YhaH (DUF805 family)
MLYLNFWKTGFTDFRTPVSRKEYWIPSMINGFIILAIVVAMFISVIANIENFTNWLTDFEESDEVADILIENIDNYDTVDDAYDDVINAVQGKESSRQAKEVASLIYIGAFGIFGQAVKLFALFWILTMITFVPSISFGIRRLKDAGLSGWLILIGLVPQVGSIILIILYCLPTKVTDNTGGEELYL